VALKSGPTRTGLTSLHGDEVIVLEIFAFENAMAVPIMRHDHVPRNAESITPSPKEKGASDC
jgi:hypothetical protein